MFVHASHVPEAICVCSLPMPCFQTLFLRQSIVGNLNLILVIALWQAWLHEQVALFQHFGPWTATSANPNTMVLHGIAAMVGPFVCICLLYCFWLFFFVGSSASIWMVSSTSFFGGIYGHIHHRCGSPCIRSAIVCKPQGLGCYWPEFVVKSPHMKKRFSSRKLWEVLKYQTFNREHIFHCQWGFSPFDDPNPKRFSQKKINHVNRVTFMKSLQRGML